MLLFAGVARAAAASAWNVGRVSASCRGRINLGVRRRAAYPSSMWPGSGSSDWIVLRSRALEPADVLILVWKNHPMRRYGLELLVAPDLSGRAEQVWREAQIEDLIWTVDTRLACGAWHLPIPGPDVGWAASAVDPRASALREAGNADPDASSLAHALRPDAARGRAGLGGERMRGRWLHADRRWPAITIERLGERRASGRRGSDGPGRRVAAGAIVATPRG